MPPIRVNIRGCDDSTVFNMDATDEERAFLERVAALSRERSTYQCMPRIVVDEGPEPEQDDRGDA